MSFAGPKEIIAEGDTVVLYLTPALMHTIDAVPQIRNKKNEMIEYVFQTSFGALKVRDLIGVRYGSRVQLTKGWAHVLQPNPELWTQTLPHRTQILYTPDISMILYQLEVRPGSVVIESGTGSGSLSHYFLRAIRPSGHLHTFDFHEERVAKAREEFVAHGLGDNVTVRQRDVCEQGFGDELNGVADAVFLDLPAPQLAVPYAAKALKNEGGRICSFSPCIEQSMRVCEALGKCGFIEVQNIEVLQVEDCVRTRNVPVMELDFLKTKRTETDGKDMKTPRESKKYITSTAPNTMAGHTGYLTIAELPPLFAR
ncbi:tRNA (adenine(58)-N(1))-methyltransferase catalytic subunit TRMT61A [Anopheles merus]|uniref:tRNA (adenine(58)-N(1))-methyltransferase catalytic subunit TRMT61A n=1 Tax=Anopheles gambiae TaxID=7165 RepID=UPI001AAD8BC6|nr:tRNA (adenine(58)-N(1))-methyltransferase catalytic subunit TRMT61A [Anopheles gambiae]XP_041761752.1 tRNA (adenine(58)-N(1))-methyltransferase catalytic subunit TRMT61A [Anopheles merus]